MKLKIVNSLPPSGDGWGRNGGFGFGSFLLLKLKREQIIYIILDALIRGPLLSTLRAN